jgi:hypothetical protein
MCWGCVQPTCRPPFWIDGDQFEGEQFRQQNEVAAGGLVEKAPLTPLGEFIKAVLRSNAFVLEVKWLMQFG